MLDREKEAAVAFVHNLDPDNDVDQFDFGIFQRCYSGENIPSADECRG